MAVSRVFGVVAGPVRFPIECGQLLHPHRFGFL